ncbi:glycosyltransferase family protein [Paraburkholderia sediminicola]|uniref:glycosyltransferase family 1 protein n=1 Tax=Paraburkholderia sediminicola TaxID=458836 RepID=UPI0038B8E293
MKVFILHPGKANYPEISAYTTFLVRHGFEVFEGNSEVYARFPSKGECVLWCLMGFYRAHAGGARFVIHDYRSLSLGRLAWVKDGIKRTFNARPNLRVFQNERMRAAMGFRDGIPSALLPMGVPDWIFNLAYEKGASAQTLPAGRFCYIGEMSRERGFDKVLSAWRDAPREAGDSFVLVGRPEPDIYEAFRHTKGLVFVGRVAQSDALQIVRRSVYAICYFPYHRPHCFQTPTKLLEYAALGKRIICNDAPSNVLACAELNIRSLVTGPSIFDELPPASQLAIEDNDPRGLRGLEWTSVIERSGVLSRIEPALSARRWHGSVRVGSSA